MDPLAQAPQAAEPPRPRLVIAVTDPMTARYLLRGQAAFLADAGFDVHVISAPGDDLDEFQRRERVAVTPVAMRRRISPLADLASLYRLTHALRRLRPDLLCASTPKAGVLGMIAGRLAGVPRRIYTLRGLPLETARGLTRATLRLAERRAAALAHRVVCVGPSLRQRVVELGLAPPDKAIVIANGSSNGVDLERFAPTAERRQEAAVVRRRLGLPSTAPVIGYVGRLTHDKGLDDLAAAFFGPLLERQPDARLLLVGAFEDADPVANETRRRLTEDSRVTVTGWVPDSAPYYGMIDLLAFPSYREGFPNAPLEAAAATVPTVGYRAVGTVDAVEHGVTGTLVPTGDVTALGAALAEALADDERRRRQGEAARARAERLFRQEIVWQAWADTFRRLLGGEEER